MISYASPHCCALTRIANTALMMSALFVALPIGALAQQPAQPAPGQDVNSKRVTLNLDNADIRYALKLLFQSAGASYTLDVGVQGRVTASLNDVSFRTALESLLRGVQSQAPLTVRIENGVYNVAPKQEDRTLAGDPPTIPEPPARQQTRIAKIQINYADPEDITTALGGTMLESRFARLASGGLGSGAGMGNGAGNRNGNMGGNTGGNLGGSSGMGLVNFGSGGFGQSANRGNQTGGSGTGVIGNFGTGFSGGRGR